MSFTEVLGFIMLFGMVAVIFIGFPISFTLLFLAIIFGESVANSPPFAPWFAFTGTQLSEKRRCSSSVCGLSHHSARPFFCSVSSCGFFCSHSRMNLV